MVDRSTLALIVFGILVVTLFYFWVIRKNAITRGDGPSGGSRGTGGGSSGSSGRGGGNDPDWSDLDFDTDPPPSPRPGHVETPPASKWSQGRGLDFGIGGPGHQEPSEKAPPPPPKPAPKRNWLALPGPGSPSARAPVSPAPKPAEIGRQGSLGGKPTSQPNDGVIDEFELRDAVADAVDDAFAEENKAEAERERKERIARRIRPFLHLLYFVISMTIFLALVSPNFRRMLPFF